jgi:hypothetical protein
MEQRVQVPPDGADEETFIQFALTYNAYQMHGNDLDALTNEVRQAWEHDRTLPDDIGVLRAVLFFEERAYKWSGGGPFVPPFNRAEFPLALVARIRELSGGYVQVEPGTA